MTSLTTPIGECINDRLSEEDLALADDERNVSCCEIVHQMGYTVKFMVPRFHLWRGQENIDEPTVSDTRALPIFPFILERIFAKQVQCIAKQHY